MFGTARVSDSAFPSGPTTPSFSTHWQRRVQLHLLVAEALTLFNLRLDGIPRECGRGMAQELQRGLVKQREASPLEIRAGQCLYVLQPCGKRCGLHQRLHRIVGDDATFLRVPMGLEMVITGAARQLRSWLGLHDQGNHIGRHPAGKQVRVSHIRQ